MIALWNDVDPGLITQWVGPRRQLGIQLDHNLPPRVQLTRQPPAQHIQTPRSVTTDYHFQTPPSSASRDEADFVAIPSSDNDAAAWLSMPTGAWLADQDKDDLTATTTTYHSEASLHDGRPGLLIDPGAVGNLSGS